MTDDDKALMETIKDAVLHGTGFMKNGKHVPIDDVYLDPRDARIEALSAEIERLRVALREAIRAMDLLDQPDDYRMMWLSEVVETARAALEARHD